MKTTIHAKAQLLADALEYLLSQTVDQDLAHGIELTEGEQDARKQAIRALHSYNEKEA